MFSTFIFYGCLTLHKILLMKNRKYKATSSCGIGRNVTPQNTYVEHALLLIITNND